MFIYIVQAVGFVGMAFAFISFQNNNIKKLLFFQTLAALSFAIHFSLLGAFTGAVMNILGASRNIIFANREKKWANNKLWMYFFILLYTVLGIFTWKDYFSILPIIAMTLATVAFWIPNPKATRFIVLPSSPCWLIYNIFNKSIAGSLTEIFVSTSLIIAIVRFDILKRKDGRNNQVENDPMSNP